ncbi:hypothetical protein [Chengkuizengella axinellae]|uniref:ABC transporter ATP-binding protein n=1 Tax=Chengkuizengella axinellae TaxID=3064388 RepID=A0ABT9IYI5_9BACL|nr:hypothetical protein [Chengkuizengella sp. 2205SS18-9]MDP5274420.1 hypothetical protein [Chengkuizengella sp. 2205SS18-9]
MEELCDRIYIINKGKVILHETPENIIKKAANHHYLDLVVEKLSNEAEIKIKKALGLKNAQMHTNSSEQEIGMQITSSSDLSSYAIELLANENIKVIRMETKKPKLEDAILALAEEKSA